MALSTENLVDSNGGGLSKTIKPGNITAKINDIQLEDFKFIEGAVHVVLNLETEPIEGFEGFFIDKDNPDLGHYQGQIGKVQASQYAFADGTTKSGIKIERDKNVLIFLKKVSAALGKDEWFLSQNNKHNTIHEFIDAFNRDKVSKDIFLDFCIAGKEYENKNGYTAHNLFLPKNNPGTYVFGEANSSKVMTFNENDHIIKMAKPVAAPVESFGDDTSLPGSDFDLDDLPY
jgi:hypothetical protein